MKVFVTSTFERSLEKLARRNIQVLTVYQKAIGILEKDPMNRSHAFNIKKLKNVQPGSWRLRIGAFRIRYDIDGANVILHLIRDRKDSYR